jgi:hypothetical protein
MMVGDVAFYHVRRLRGPGVIVVKQLCSELFFFQCELAMCYNLLPRLKPLRFTWCKVSEHRINTTPSVYRRMQFSLFDESNYLKFD